MSVNNKLYIFCRPAIVSGIVVVVLMVIILFVLLPVQRKGKWGCFAVVSAIYAILIPLAFFFALEADAIKDYFSSRPPKFHGAKDNFEFDNIFDVVDNNKWDRNV